MRRENSYSYKLKNSNIMRKDYPGFHPVRHYYIHYVICTSHINQMDILRCLGHEYAICYVFPHYELMGECTNLEQFLYRMDRKFIVRVEDRDGRSELVMADPDGRPAYKIDGSVRYSTMHQDGSMRLTVAAFDVKPESIREAILRRFPDSEVYYKTDDEDGTMHRTNDARRKYFKPHTYSFGFFIKVCTSQYHVFAFRSTSDDIDKACECMANIGFDGEHTEQALTEFVQDFPIVKEGDYVFFNKLEIDN